MKAQYQSEGGLLVKQGTNECAGYIFNFTGHGAYGPHKIEPSPTEEQIKAHNRILAQAEVDGMIKHGQAVLYVHHKSNTVGTWDSSFTWPVEYKRSSFHNMAGKDGRRDFWFSGPDGKHWHGVNIGDNDIVRCKRIKS